MTYDEMLSRAKALKGKTLRTVTGKEFSVGVYMDCPFFIPASTHLGRSDGRRAAEWFLARFNELGSLRPGDYQDLTRNASYFVALVDPNFEISSVDSRYEHEAGNGDLP